MNLERKVCQFPAVPEDQDQLLFHTLQPGEKFITIYGVVEVVKDDRETPTATRLANYKKVVINWQRSKGKREAQLSKAFISNAKFLRARRMKVNALYEKGNLKRASVFRAYFGEEPRLMKLVNRIEKPTTQQLQPDPMAPVSSFPDRIVECVLIPDRRAHYHGEDANSLTSKLTAVQDKACEQRMRTTRLFLKRRLLTERYNEDFLTFSCLDCGQGFASNAGLRYHISGGKNCTQQGAAISRVRKEKLAEVEEGAMDLLAGKHSAPRPRRVDRRIRRPDRKRKKESAMYPEVLLSLGYTLVKQDIKFTDDMKLPEPLQIQEDTNEDKIKETVTGSLSVDAPDALLGYLKKELVATQRKADDQKYGALYAEVFKTLGYWKPRRKRQSTRNGNDIDTSKRRRRALKSPPPPKPEPPIIDTRALADEVDSGRYPSMNRFKGDDHSNICKVCQDGGVLICCDFCTNAIHIACLRTKFTVKAPEPEDDFMCHNCIQTILSRRNRAEKRRLKKEARKVQRTEQRALEESKINSDIQQGMEYEFLAEKGKDTSELVELLQDAQVRLRQSLATAKMNNVRRRIMGCYFNNERDEN